jgi:hypothetical protein
MVRRCENSRLVPARFPSLADAPLTNSLDIARVNFEPSNFQLNFVGWKNEFPRRSNSGRLFPLRALDH